MAGPLPARPAEVVRGLPSRALDPVDLLVVLPADVADPDLVRAGADRDPEGVAQPGGDDAAAVRVAAREVRVSGEPRPGHRVDADHGAVEARRVARRVGVLRPQRAALGARGRHRPARRVSARVVGRLAVVGVHEARPVARAGIERPVGPELDVADRMARELLAPVVDQDLLAADHRVPGDLEARQAAADDASVRGVAGRGRARVGAHARRAPAGGGARRSRRRTCRARRRTGFAGKLGCSARPSRPRSQPLKTFVRRSATVVAVVSEKPSKTLTRPLFSATNTLPSERELDLGELGHAAEGDRVLEAGGKGAAAEALRR